jgi:hypothetical protein
MNALSSLPWLPLGVLLAIATGCSTRANPDFCCVTPETCAAAGLIEELRPCGVGQACKAYGCVAAECATSADCTSAAAPACLRGLCVAGCAADDDCAGIAGRPRCDGADATCVGCTASDQCPSDRAICDAEVRTCRGCTADDQCASGVCIEATGQCAAADAILYVMNAGTDAGTCPNSAPCKTIPFAQQMMTPDRNVIRILGANFYLGDSTVYLEQGVSLDGDHTALSSTARLPIRVSGLANIEGVRLAASDMLADLIYVSAGGGLTLSKVSVQQGSLVIGAGGSLGINSSTFDNAKLECNQGGKLDVRGSYLEHSVVDSYCELMFSGNRVEPDGAQRLPTPSSDPCRRSRTMCSSVTTRTIR